MSELWCFNCKKNLYYNTVHVLVFFSNFDNYWADMNNMKFEFRQSNS